MTQYQSILQEATAPFADKRIHYCDLTINDDFMLTGAVLDEQTKTAVITHLQSKLSQKIDGSQVTILRQPTPTNLQVSTTITTLFEDPGWINKPASQLLNGQTVEYLQEKEAWVFVRQMDGYLGWMYRPYLGETDPSTNTHLVCAPVAMLKDKPQSDANLVSRVLAGTAVSIQETANEWGKIKLVGGITGWLPLQHLREQNSHPQAEDALRQQMIADAHTLIGVPYLWGGSSAYGIDCSGFAQLVHWLSGITLLRDADMQMENGRIVEPPHQPGDLFFFGASGGHRRISHVGISLGGWEMIHSSRSKNGVYVDHVQEVAHLRDTFLGARTYVGV